jgi:hypothetical protein
MVPPALSPLACSSVMWNSLRTEPASAPALAKWPAAGLGHAAWTPPTECHLHGRIAVGGGGLDLGHAVVGHVHDRHRHGIAIVGEKPGHANLAADKS